MPLTLRLLNKTIATVLSSPEHKRVRASQPLPAHAYSSLPAAAIQRGSTRQRKELVRVAARSGSLEAVDASLAATRLSHGDWLLRAAAEAPGPGVALALCQQLAARGWLVKWGAYRTPLHTAAAAGNADVCQWLQLGQLGILHYDVDAVYAAAEAGHAALAAGLLSLCPDDNKRYSPANRLLEAAARGYGVVDFTGLWKECVNGTWEDLQRQQQQEQQLAQQGQQQENNCFSVWCPNGLKLRASASELASPLGPAGLKGILAAAAGSPTPCWLDKLDMLLQLPCGSDEAAAVAAAAVVAAKLAARPDLLSDVLAGAMSAPDGLARVRLLWEQRGWRLAEGSALEAAVAAAGKRGDTAAISYLFDNLGAHVADGYPIPNALLLPANCGHLPVLQLLASHGVRCSGGTFAGLAGCAVLDGHTHILDYLLCKQAPPPPLLEPPAGSWAESAVRKDAIDRALGYGVYLAITSCVQRAYELNGARFQTEGGGPLVMEGTVSWSPGMMELLEKMGYPFNRTAALYKSMKGDVSMIRALARLRFCGPDCHIALTSLLGDPAVPLDEIRWLLEGDGGGGGGGEAGAEGGAAGPSEGPTPTAAPKPGPAASLVLRDEALWQQVLEAAGRRGQGQAAGEVRAWLEGWRQANMKPPGDSNERWQGPRARAEGSWGGWKHRAADDTWQFCIT
ncbi:hypothetical protein CHLRE_04g229750v5 [Chlamydomonas reinhardtii]|uniref:Uncharacterized protein n=1 Tax=Chlamydomonas reinhardtii TaxID=3055 RepID=A0A2K3DUV5_CHLRE|nr:uncharacterized protein CHLRE_04g229750v5 [Chlamydomonas reinhardtii]PNW84330.1 hypothetical protein CHLRE_04g229750v5 [Chlamydomonas reinhardtii]